jgi:uncharacterized protein (DUF2147 family)
MKERVMSRIVNHTTLSMARPAITLAALLALAACGQAQESKPSTGQLGTWLTESGNLEVEIAPCGQALCGTVVKVVANRSMSEPGKSLPSDAPSPLGMKVLTDFTPSGDGEWRGQIYNRENGKTYDCLMSLESSDQLKVRPYVGMPMLGKTQIWRRVAAAAEQK